MLRHLKRSQRLTDLEAHAVLIDDTRRRVHQLEHELDTIRHQLANLEGDNR